MNQSHSQSVENGSTGSPLPGEPVFLAVGRLRRPHGLHGEVLMELMTDFPERLSPGVRLYMEPDYRAVFLNSVRQHSKGMLVSFEGYDTPEQVGELRNRLLMVRVDELQPLPPGEFYQHQILGLEVYTDDGEQLGVVSEILETGANDVYLVKTQSGTELLLPGTDEVILDINIDLGKIRVRLLPGLIPDEKQTSYRQIGS